MSFVASAGAVLAGVLAAVVVGYSVVRLFATGLLRSEKLAWSLATGLLVQALLFLACVAILPGSKAAPVLAVDIVVVAASVVARRPRPEWAPFRPIAAGVLALLVLAGGAWLVFLVDAVAEPMWSTDYLAIWGFKGKTIAETGTVPRRLFDDPALYWAHREYPLLVPLSLATLASLAGGWDDQALALLFPACALATLLALFGFLARRVTLLAGAAAAALASLDFFLYQGVNAGTAEVPFALSLVLVSCAFLDVLDGPLPGAVARLFTGSLLCVSIKQEGTLFVGLLALALLLRRGVRRRAWALAVPPVLHWTALYFLRGPQTRRDFDLTLFEPGRWSELPARFGMVAGRILTTETIQAGIPLLAVVAFLAVTRRGIGDPLLPVFPAQILCYAIAFSVSSFDPIYAIDGAFRRIALTLFPAFTIVLGARLRPAGSDA